MDEKRKVYDFLGIKETKQMKEISKEFKKGQETHLSLCKEYDVSEQKLAQLIINEEETFKKNFRLEEEAEISIDELRRIHDTLTIGERKVDQAKSELVEANLRLVVSIAKKYTNRGGGSLLSQTETLIPAGFISDGKSNIDRVVTGDSVPWAPPGQIPSTRTSVIVAVTADERGSEDSNMIYFYLGM